MNIRCRYRYDALDQLIGLEPVGQARLQRFYRHPQLVTEQQGPAAQSVFQHGQQLLAMQSLASDTFTSQLLCTDQQRSVLQVTEQAGPRSQVYTPYGHRRAESGLGSLLGFNGERRDPETGYYLLGNGYRAFNPVLMRFNSPDSLSPFDRGGLNPYAYCLGDPVNFSDPTGRVARLITSLFSVANARVVMSAAVPYKVAKDALLWGAAGQLPFRYTVGAAGSTVAGISTMLAALTGVGSAVAAIAKDTETAAALGFIALGLGALTLAGRVGSGWAARDPKTISELKNFAANRGQVMVKNPAPAALTLTTPAPQTPRQFAPSAPPQTPGTFAASVPAPIPGPVARHNAPGGIKRKHDGTPVRVLVAKRYGIRQT